LAALGRVRELDAVLAEVLLLPSDPDWGTPALGMYAVAADELRPHGFSAHADSVIERGIRFAEGVGGPVKALPRQRHQMAELCFRGGLLAASRALFARVLRGSVS